MHTLQFILTFPMKVKTLLFTLKRQTANGKRKNWQENYGHMAYLDVAVCRKRSA